MPWHSIAWRSVAYHTSIYHVLTWDSIAHGVAQHTEHGITQRSTAKHDKTIPAQRHSMTTTQLRGGFLRQRTSPRLPTSTHLAPSSWTAYLEACLCTARIFPMAIVFPSVLSVNRPRCGISSKGSMHIERSTYISYGKEFRQKVGTIQHR